jgi:hypothetical protein
MPPIFDKSCRRLRQNSGERFGRIRSGSFHCRCCPRVCAFVRLTSYCAAPRIATVRQKSPTERDFPHSPNCSRRMAILPGNFGSDWREVTPSICKVNALSPGRLRVTVRSRAARRMPASFSPPVGRLFCSIVAKFCLRLNDCALSEREKTAIGSKRCVSSSAVRTRPSNSLPDREQASGRHSVQAVRRLLRYPRRPFRWQS